MKMPFGIRIGFANSWAGEWMTHRNLSLFSITSQLNHGDWNLWILVFNVGLWLNVYSKKQWQERCDRQWERVKTMLHEYREAHKDDAPWKGTP